MPTRTYAYLQSGAVCQCIRGKAALFNRRKIMSDFTSNCPQKKQKSRSQVNIAVGILLVVALVIFLGLFHIVKGSNIIGFLLIPRSSFGFSEMVVDVDKITSMPMIAAMSSYPLGVKACQRRGLIETDEQFKRRTRQEFEEEFQREHKKHMENLERETKRLIDSLNN
jgi:hypothetical protein